MGIMCDGNRRGRVMSVSEVCLCDGLENGC